MKGKLKYNICVPLLALALHTYAQEDNGALIEKYKTQNAVITNYTEKLIITNESGKLVSNSYITKDKLLISDLSPDMYNKQYIYHGYYDRLTDLDAYVYIPVKDGFKKLKDYETQTRATDRDNVFYDDGQETEIAFTGLTKHALMHTSYSLSHIDLHLLPIYYFQENLPMIKSVFEVTFPKYVNMKFALEGTHTDWIKQTKKETRNTITYTFTMDSLPAIKIYDDIPSISYYVPHVVPYIASYKLPHTDTSIAMLSNPDELYQFVYSFIKDVDTGQDELLSNTVTEITKGDITQREKAAHIYEWVQKNIHYIAFEDSLEGYVPRQAVDIYRRKFGDCKDFSSILVAMCRQAGLNAYFTWIGTRHLPYTYEETPLPIVDNHMICAIKLDDKWVFMDGTDPMIPFGQNPDAIQGKEAMIAINPKKYKIIKVPETSENTNTITDSTVMHISANSIIGNIAINYKGYPAWSLENGMGYYKNEGRDKVVKNITSRGSNRYIQHEYTYVQNDTGNKDARVAATFTVDDYVQQVGNEYYVNMNVKRYDEDGHLDPQDRTVPFWSSFKLKTKQVVVLQIPQGYHVTYLPQETTGTMAGYSTYKIAYTATATVVILTKEYDWHALSMPVEKFAESNKLVDGLKNVYKESIVLTANKAAK